VLIASVVAAFAEEQKESRVPKVVGSDGSEPAVKRGCENLENQECCQQSFCKIQCF
jgi:hypothetical protein